ncbi:alpha/beta fold hydrolase, partial [Streptomyces sp. SID3343]|uniref:alpha/beta fold hydrolase n=1 Tax=Streptomyces sp. SID3343 TaxID=2690260 RepID=UPI00136E900D
ARLLPLLLARPDDPLSAQATLTGADQTGTARYVSQLRAQAARVDALPGLRQVRCPTLVVAGEMDRLCPPEYHHEIADAIATARLHVLPGAGHLTPLERPADIAALLGPWWARAAREETR